MKKFKNLIYLFLVFVVSCHDNKKETDGAIETLSIDVDKISAVDFSELFTEIEIVPLETSEESLLGNSIKYAYNEKLNCYFIFDRQQETLFCFDENGKFQFSSAHLKGSGPGEYINGRDFNYNPFDSTCEIMDIIGRIYKYDEKMQFVRRLNDKERIRHRATSFIPLSEDMYALYDFDGKDDMLYFYSESEDTIKKTIRLKKLIFIISSEQPFTFTDNQTCLLPPSFSNTLYRIDLDSLSLVPVFSVDYGKKTMTEDVAKNYGIEESMNLFRNGSSDGYVFTHKILQNDNMYCVVSPSDTSIYITLYNKNSKQMRLFSKISNGAILYPFLLTNDVWYNYTDASNINDMIDKAYLTEESKLRLLQIKDDDNPVIVKYYLK